jgi:hypothetical protein
MKTLKNEEKGNVLSPSSDVITLDKVDKKIQLVKDVVDKLVSKTNFQFFKGKFTGQHYLIYLDEQPGTALSAGAIEAGWGKKYNPKPIYQRPGDQHTVKVQKQILSDFLSGERIGTMAFYNSIENFPNVDVVDGVQRGTIIYNFLKGNMVLDGALAAKFWAYWLKTIINGMYDPTYDETTRRSCEAVLVAIHTSKSTPKVKFTNLPINLQQDIRQLSVDTKHIRDVIFTCIETQDRIYPGHEDYDKSKVTEMIRFKFNKLNVQQKPVDAVHLIWGSSSDYNKISRSYVETNPELMSALGYSLEQNPVKDEKLLRAFNEIVIRSMLVYDNQLRWSLGCKKFAENILDNVYEYPNEESKSVIFMESFLENVIEKVFSTEFVDANNITRRINLASEIVGKNQKTVIHRTFIVSLMVFYDFIQKNPQAKSKYFDNDEPTVSLYNFIELLSKLISSLSLLFVRETNWISVETSPLVRYGFVGMYHENQELFNELVLLQKSGTSGVSPTDTLRKVIKLVDSHTL